MRIGVNPFLNHAPVLPLRFASGTTLALPRASVVTDGTVLAHGVTAAGVSGKTRNHGVFLIILSISVTLLTPYVRTGAWFNRNSTSIFVYLCKRSSL